MLSPTSLSHIRGPWISEHPRIAKVSLTGSVGAGKAVMRSAAGSLKRITLELGGNDAAVVMDDVNPKAIAPFIFPFLKLL
jgi:acyl-CoA reductase-like NAD-dependent aldehyde dehydrogenase